ncbi:hypothetical protein Dsin_025303 [Dipteronia sinensis]|uniref:BZIP domain-containing protein n=1 Tax=Dipteronia sinensis TaxID=43782 RepID=A0AAD9ZX28_9ROSI|nr:hypothetical protein Dsin_025303 [Dipteronia sinensis]
MLAPTHILATHLDPIPRIHTCFHVHTKIVAPSSEGKVSTDDTAESSEKKSKKRPTGNREAVRKYREKKKARTASLEDEVVRLRAVNQQLLKRLQGLNVCLWTFGEGLKERLDLFLIKNR